MQILHDVHVNWLDGGSRAYSIPEYHEWRKDDPVELIDTIPLIKVEPELFSVIEDDYISIPQELLNQVHRVAVKVYKETNRKRKIEYCFIISDGKRVLAIDTEGDNKPNLKSRLTPRHENLVLEIATQMDIISYEIPYEEVDEGRLDDSLMEQLLTLEPAYFVGLTRAEKEMKEILFDCLFNLSCSENIQEVRYWFTELFPKSFSTEYVLEKDVMIESMFHFIKDGWSKQHEDFGSQLMKFNDIYKDEWIELVKRNKKKDKVTN